MELERHSCPDCDIEFEVACESELQEKLRKHKCQLITGKVFRTQQLQQQEIGNFIEDVAIDRIHQHKLDKLVAQGIIV